MARNDPARNFRWSIVRRVLPAAVLAIAIVGWLRLRGEEAGLYGPGTGVLLMALANVVLVAIVIAWTSRLADQANTARLGAERTLLETEAHLARAILASPIPALIHDENNRNLHVSAGWTRYSGYTLEDIPTLRDWTRKAYGEAQDFANEYIDQLFEIGGTVQNGEWVVRAKDGSRRIWEFQTTPLGRSATGTRLLLSVATDITERKEAEATLRVSESRLRLATDAAGLGVWEWEIAPNLLAWTPAAKAMFGLPQETVMSYEIFLAALHPDDRAPTDQQVRRSLDERTEFVTEYRSVWPDGTVRWIAARGGGLYGEDGSAERMLGVVADITERKEAEAAQARLAAIVESSPLAIVGKSLDGVVTSWNGAAEQLLGYTAAEIVGQPLTRVIPSELLDEERDILRRVAAGGRVHYQETTRVARDGTRLTVELTAAPVRLRGGSIAGVSSVMKDIGARKQAENALRESELKFRTLAEALPQLVWTCLPDGHCDYLSRQWLDYTGIPEDEQLGYGWANQIHSDDRAGTQAAWEAAVSTERDLNVEFRIRRHDGEYRWFKTRATPLRNPSGTIVKWFGTNTDIEDLKQAHLKIVEMNALLESRVRERTAELEESNKELEAFSYSVSHDLRAPQRAVDSFSLVLLEDYGASLDDEAKRLLGIVRDEAQRMGRLIDDLLEFSRAGRRGIQVTECDMTRLARAAFEELPADARANARLDLADLPSARGDPALLRQVWVNLLSNALKFSARAAAPAITVRGEVSNGTVTYSVIDNGVGFDPRFVGKLFGVFQRLHSASEFEGTGVGLALVQRIVHRHGGTVAGEGAVDAGATFRFSLPNRKE